MDLKIFDLDLTDFASAWQRQKEVFAQVKMGSFNFALVFCRHYPVITLSRTANPKNILASAEELKHNGIVVHQIERGGEVTYHGPGQLVVYPIFNLQLLKPDLHWYLRQLEEVILGALHPFGIIGQRRIGLTGVWFGERKIASIGIAVRNWITFHGLSINIKSDDLSNFRLIRPCGMDIEMIALEEVLGYNIPVSQIKENLISQFRGAFFAQATEIPLREMVLFGS